LLTNLLIDRLAEEIAKVGGVKRERVEREAGILSLEKEAQPPKAEMQPPKAGTQLPPEARGLQEIRKPRVIVTRAGAIIQPSVRYWIRREVFEEHLRRAGNISPAFQDALQQYRGHILLGGVAKAVRGALSVADTVAGGVLKPFIEAAEDAGGKVSAKSAMEHERWLSTLAELEADLRAELKRMGETATDERVTVLLAERLLEAPELLRSLERTVGWLARHPARVGTIVKSIAARASLNTTLMGGLLSEDAEADITEFDKKAHELAVERARAFVVKAVHIVETAKDLQKAYKVAAGRVNLSDKEVSNRTSLWKRLVEARHGVAPAQLVQRYRELSAKGDKLTDDEKLELAEISETFLMFSEIRRGVFKGVLSSERYKQRLQQLKGVADRIAEVQKEFDTARQRVLSKIGKECKDEWSRSVVKALGDASKLLSEAVDGALRGKKGGAGSPLFSGNIRVATRFIGFLTLARMLARDREAQRLIEKTIADICNAYGNGLNAIGYRFAKMSPARLLNELLKLAGLPPLSKSNTKSYRDVMKAILKRFRKDPTFGLQGYSKDDLILAGANSLLRALFEEGRRRGKKVSRLPESGKVSKPSGGEGVQKPPEAAGQTKTPATTTKPE
jgi:hypothetical protein